MFAFLFAAQAFGIINQYFEKEVSEKDFWDAPKEGYQGLSEEEKQQKWFMINPEKLKNKYRLSNEALIVSEAEKAYILKAFKMIYEEYSKELPESASFKERLLITKGSLPPEFFPSESRSEGCKIIPFKGADMGSNHMA